MLELLIVDNEKFVVENLAMTYPWSDLQIGYVHKSYSAREALEIIQSRTIHIVISDIRMPGMNGLELIDRIKEVSPRTKCLLLSGYSDFEYAQRAISSQVESYLLKPVKEEELMRTIRSTIEQIESEWQAVISRQRTLYTLNENLPLLRGTLLSELLYGSTIPQATLRKRLETYQLSILPQQRFAMMLVRLEHGFSGYDDHSRSLLEFAIANISEEIFGLHFALWQCKDVHGNLVFVITEKDSVPDNAGRDDKHVQTMIEKYTLQVQESVVAYLKAGISVLISDWGVFPDDIYTLYQKSVAMLHSHPDNTDGFFINGINTIQTEEFQPLRTVQEPPMLMNLLEAGRWDAAEQKLNDIIEEVRGKQTHVTEYMKIVALLINFSTANTIHKHGQTMSEFSDYLLDDPNHKIYRSIDTLHSWGLSAIRAIRDSAVKDAEGSQRSIILKINQFVQDHLAHDVSLQTIAEQVYLHPAYVSKIYKLETGEGLSDYIYRLRMEKAAHLLSETNARIQDIARQIGYQNPSHFSRIFRKYYDMSPEDYREMASARQ